MSPQSLAAVLTAKELLSCDDKAVLDWSNVLAAAFTQALTEGPQKPAQRSQFPKGALPHSTWSLRLTESPIGPRSRLCRV